MTATLSKAPMPLQDPIARPKRKQFERRGQEDPLQGLISNEWVDFFNSLTATVDNTPTRIANVSKAGQEASILATDFSGGSLASGLYRISYYARVTRVASTSSSLTVGLDWTDGVSQTYTGAAMTGNLLTTYQSHTMLIDIDGGSPVRYSTTYASVGASPMAYKLEITLERVHA